MDNGWSETKTKLARNASYLLPDPGGQVVRELLDEIDRLRNSRDWYQRRIELLSKEQTRMRYPERTLVCDILANGRLLPDPDGKRYGTINNHKEGIHG